MTITRTKFPSNSKYVILIAEDEPEIAEILAAYLSRDGLKSIHAADGQQALELHLSMKPDLVLLDVQMPRVDGWRVLSEIRSRGNTPVIMLTALDQDIDKLLGLRIGADDYVVKPFNPAEVAARIRAVLRRSTFQSDAMHQKVIRVGFFEIDIENHSVRVTAQEQSQLLQLTLTEFNLLVHLARNPKRVCTRAELFAACLPEGDSQLRTVDSHISKLRRKLDAIGLAGIPNGVRGVGYKLWEGGE